MKQPPQDPRDGPERRNEAAPQQGNDGRSGRPESAASRETFPERTREPGKAGLANEARPGLGTRARKADPSQRPTTSEELPDDDETTGKPRATPRGYEEPRPEPRESPSDSMQQQEERDTGVSGHSSGD